MKSLCGVNQLSVSSERFDRFVMRGLNARHAGPYSSLATDFGIIVRAENRRLQDEIENAVRIMRCCWQSCSRSSCHKRRIPHRILAPWEIGPFTRPAEGNPVIAPRPESTFVDPVLKTPAHWEALHTFNPAAIVRDGKVYVLYRAEDDSGAMEIGGHTSRLGLAESEDGIHFTRRAAPVFFPAEDAEKAREWPGGVEDTRIVEAEDGTYVLTYTQWNRQTYSVGIATSPDLLHWTKYGLKAFFGEMGGKVRHAQVQVGGRLSRVSMKAKPVDRGEYRRPVLDVRGEGSIHLARSPDLIHWTPTVLIGLARPARSAGPARKTLDSTFPETGPPPILTSKGIVVLTTGKMPSREAILRWDPMYMG